MAKGKSKEEPKDGELEQQKEEINEPLADDLIPEALPPDELPPDEPVEPGIEAVEASLEQATQDDLLKDEFNIVEPDEGATPPEEIAHDEFADIGPVVIKPKRRIPWKRIFGILIPLILLAGLIGGGIGYYIYLKNKPIAVSTTMSLRGEIKDVVSATGKVEANKMTPVTPVKNDTVIEVLVAEGDEVTAGQNLVKLTTNGFVTAPIAGRVVNVTVKVNDEVRGTTPPVITPTPTTPTTPTAPTTTTPTDQTQTPATTTPSTTITQAQAQTQVATVLMTIADMNPTYVIASVDETDISKIKVAQKAEMVLDAYPTKKLKGDIKEIGVVATTTATGGTAFPVKIQVTQAKNVDLRLGMSADVEVIVETKEDALRVPVTAVTTDNGKDIVYVVKNNVAEKTTVKLGLLSGEYYEVLGGLTEGDEVVVKGLDLLKGRTKADVKAKRT
ncbi:MAG: efflux RND transporter periplasmic adaptor subunit [Actinomycetota bacterium]